jgi:hypothetical protein
MFYFSITIARANCGHSALLIQMNSILSLSVCTCMIFFKVIHTWKKILGRSFILLLFFILTLSVNQLHVNKIFYVDYQSKFHIPNHGQMYTGFIFSYYVWKQSNICELKNHSTANIVCTEHVVLWKSVVLFILVLNFAAHKGLMRHTPYVCNLHHFCHQLVHRWLPVHLQSSLQAYCQVFNLFP